MKRIVFGFFVLIANLAFSQYNVDTIPGGVSITNLYNNTIKHYSNSTCLYASSRNNDNFVIYNKNGGNLTLITPSTSASGFTILGTAYATAPLAIEALNELTAFKCGLSAESEPFPKNLDTTQADTSLALKFYFERQNDTLSELLNKPQGSDSLYIRTLEQTYKDSTSEVISLLNDLLSIPYDTSQTDTSLASAASDSTYILQFEQTYKDSTTEVIDLLTELLNIPYDTTQADTSLTDYFAEFDRNNDTLSAILSELYLLDHSDIDTNNLSTIETTLTDILTELEEPDTVNVNNDSINVHVLNTIDLSDLQDSISALINEVKLLDHSDVDTNNLQPLIDAVINDTSVYVTNLQELIDSLTSQNEVREIQLDSLLSILEPDTTTDTVKVPVYQALLKQTTALDTFYNCNGLAFSWLSSATGSVTFTDEFGNNLTLAAGEVLPLFPSDGVSFYNRIIVNATGSTGLVLNGKGCQTEEGNPCVTLEPLEDCDSGTIIPLCEGWQSVSGVWQSASGCWNSN